MTGRIAFDFTPAQLDVGGSGVYTRELGKALGELLGDRMVPIICPATRPPSERRTTRDRAHTLLRDLWWYQGGAARAARRAGAELLHVSLPSRRTAGAPPMVVTVFDVAVLRFPEKFRRWFRMYSLRTMPGFVRSATAVVTLSEASKQEIIEIIGIPAGRITVVSCGVADIFRAHRSESDLSEVRGRYGIEGPFAFTVGYIEPRKNLERLLRAIAAVRRMPGCENVQLVHAGPGGWLSGDLPRLVEELGLGDAVRFLGAVPLRDLAALYRAARVTVYTSLYEGFGLPVAEAMASGCPVITSNCSSMVEVAGDAAELVDPTSISAIAGAVERVWRDEHLRARLSERGVTHAARYTWRAAAEATAEVYRRTLGGG